jgi:hypothetical protein
VKRPTRRALIVAFSAAAAATMGVRAAGPISIAVPGRASANLSLASDGSSVVLVWSAAAADGATDIYAATSGDGGATFSPPGRVNAEPGDARANGEQPPRVSFVRRAGGVAQADVVWIAKRASGTVLLTARSFDLGSSVAAARAPRFAATSVVGGSEAAGNRGWQSTAADSNGAVHVAWLDHRRLAERDSQMAAMHHHDAGDPAPAPTATKPDGVAMAELSQVYFSTLDGSAARPVTGGVCYCCKTAMAAGPSGEIYLAWRHVYSGNLRDIAFAASRDGGRTFAAPVRVSEDKWAIEGCPEDGPVLGVDGDARIHVVWPTVVTENGDMTKALFHAVSRDGRSFSERSRLPSNGQANHPQLTFAGDGSLVVAWDESGGGRRIALARGTPAPDGRVRFERMSSSGDRIGTYPALAKTPGGFVLAWTTGDPARSTLRVESFK